MKTAESQQLSSSQQIAELRKLRQGAAAYVLGIGSRALRDRSAPRNTDGTYDGQELVRWHLAQIESELSQKANIDRELAGEDADIFSGTNSPWLERCRREKARELARKNEVEEGRLLYRDVVERDIMALAKVLQESFADIESKFGGEAGDAIREALEEARSGFEKIVGARIETEQGDAPDKKPSRGNAGGKKKMRSKKNRNKRKVT